MLKPEYHNPKTGTKIALIKVAHEVTSVMITRAVASILATEGMEKQYVIKLNKVNVEQEIRIALRSSGFAWDYECNYSRDELEHAETFAKEMFPKFFEIYDVNRG